LAGIGGSSRLLPGSSMFGSCVRLHALLELLPRAEGDHGARRDRDLLARLRVAARTLVLAAQVEVADARQLDLATTLQALAQRLEERVDELLGLTLVQPDFLVQPLGHFRLGQRHVRPLPGPQPLILAPCADSSAAVTSATTPSTSRSVRVRESSCRINPMAKPHKPYSTPLPALRSYSCRTLRAATHPLRYPYVSPRRAPDTA